jgi:hypothetical protein
VRRGPLTAAQRQLWALDRCTEFPAALNLSYALAVDGPLDADALADAFATLVRCHEPLRTTYLEHEDGVLAEVGDDSVALRAVDLSPRTVDEAQAALLAREDQARGFDLTKEAPIRATLLRLGDQRHVLLLTLHHIAADGWSLYLLNKEISANYAARRRGEDIASVSHRLECLEVARAQQAWLSGPEAEAETRWWTDQLRGADPRPSLPWPARRDAGTELARQVVALPDELTARLGKAARQAGASLFVVMLTAFEVLLERWTGCAEAVIGTLAANRQTADSAGVMGAHYNPLLLTTDVTGDPSLAECLLRTTTRTVRALDRQVLPFAYLAERLEHELGWDAVGLPRAMFLTDRYPVEGLKLAGCELTGLYVDDQPGAVTTVPAATAADLTFFVREAGERLTLSVFYPYEPSQDSVVAGAMGAYLEILAALCEEPQLPVSELSLAPATPVRPAPEPRHGPELRRITTLGPVDALSPVGGWAGPFDHARKAVPS